MDKQTVIFVDDLAYSERLQHSINVQACIYVIYGIG